MPWTILLVTPAQSAPGDGLSLGAVVDWLPTDAASLVTLGLVIGSAVLVLWAGRPKS